MFRNDLKKKEESCNIAKSNIMFKEGTMYSDPFNKNSIFVTVRNDMFVNYRGNNNRVYCSGTAKIEKDGSGIEYIRVRTGGEIESVFFAKRPFINSN